MLAKTERDGEIVALLRSGRHTLQSIGDLFGLTRESIRLIARREGVSERHGFTLMRERAKARRAAAVNIPQIIADYQSGLSLERVAERHCSTRDLIKQALIDSGTALRRYSSRGLCENTRQVMELHRSGMNQSEIADGLGISIALVKAIRFRYKLKRQPWQTHQQCYPYLRERRDDATGLLALVNSLVPPQVPHFIRADVCQDVILAILEGDVAAGENLTGAARKALTKVRRMHPFLFAPLSLDQEIPGTDGLRMIDTIRSDQPHF